LLADIEAKFIESKCMVFSFHIIATKMSA